MSNIWHPDVTTQVEDHPHNNPFSFGANGTHSGQHIAHELSKHEKLLVQKRDIGDSWTATDCDGNQIGWPGRWLEPCEIRHIKSMVWRMWAIRLCFLLFLIFGGITIYAL